MATLEQMRASAQNESDAWKNVLSRWKDGQTKRIRFLVGFEENVAVKAHNIFVKGNRDAGIDFGPCGDNFGKPCPICEELKAGTEREIKTREMFAWPVWVYNDAPDAKTKGYLIILYFAWGNASPIPALGHYYQKNGLKSFLSRDFSITREGSEASNTKYLPLPEDPTPFALPKDVKVPNKHEILKMIAQARYPAILVEEPLEEEPEEQVSAVNGVDFAAKLAAKNAAQEEGEVSGGELDVEAEEDFIEMDDDTKAQIEALKEQSRAKAAARAAKSAKKSA
jgi:hypothetical protein